MVQRELADACLQRVLLAQAFHGPHLRLLIDQVEQAADATHGEVTKCGRFGHQLDEGGLAQQITKGIFGGEVPGASGPFAH